MQPDQRRKASVELLCLDAATENRSTRCGFTYKWEVQWHEWSRKKTVENSLRRANLVRGGVGDKEVVFMEEPTVGLDLVLRTSLWNVIKHAKQDRTIILTTHSMEEAEALCDRIGVLADVCLQCIASPLES